MKNANKRPYWSQNTPDRPTLTESIVHFIVATVLFVMLIVLFSCSSRIAKPNSYLQSMRSYVLSGEQTIEAHKETVFIIDKKNKRLYSIYVAEGKVFISDSITQ